MGRPVQYLCQTFMGSIKCSNQNLCNCVIWYLLLSTSVLEFYDSDVYDLWYLWHIHPSIHLQLRYFTLGTCYLSSISVLTQNLEIVWGSLPWRRDSNLRSLDLPLDHGASSKFKTVSMAISFLYFFSFNLYSPTIL